MCVSFHTSARRSARDTSLSFSPLIIIAITHRVQYFKRPVGKTILLTKTQTLRYGVRIISIPFFVSVYVLLRMVELQNNKNDLKSENFELHEQEHF